MFDVYPPDGSLHTYKRVVISFRVVTAYPEDLVVVVDGDMAYGLGSFHGYFSESTVTDEGGDTYFFLVKKSSDYQSYKDINWKVSGPSDVTEGTYSFQIMDYTAPYIDIIGPVGQEANPLHPIKFMYGDEGSGVRDVIVKIDGMMVFDGTDFADGYSGTVENGQAVIYFGASANTSYDIFVEVTDNG